MDIIKHLIVLLVFHFSLQLYSQSQYDVQIVTQSNDTLIGTMKVNTRLKFKGFVLPSSFNENVRFTSNDGNYKKISAKDIQQLNFKDKTGTKRKFVRLNEYKHHIVEVIYLNNLKWYKHYYFDTYNNTENIVYEFFDENNKQFTVGVFNSKKKKLKLLTNNDPEIKSFIKNNKMTDENILKVFKMYESKL